MASTAFLLRAPLCAVCGCDAWKYDVKQNAMPNVTESLVRHLDAIMQTCQGGILLRSVISEGKFNVSNLLAEVRATESRKKCLTPASAAH